MYDPKLRFDLDANLREVCDAMRTHKRAIDEVIEQFKHCSHQSRKTLATSYKTLDRLKLSPDRDRRKRA